MAAATRHRLIDAAIKRFYRDGFRNVGIDQILTDVGISKTAFYKHFECKDDLMLAALERQNVWLQSTAGGTRPSASFARCSTSSRRSWNPMSSRGASS
jgi:AcrR family transcriptional regulator